MQEQVGKLSEKLRAAEAKVAEGEQSQGANTQQLTQQLQDARGEFAQLQVMYSAMAGMFFIK